MEENGIELAFAKNIISLLFTQDDLLNIVMSM
jgi:hypothetical protein